MSPQNTLKIDYPFKPYLITQKWGNITDAYSKAFNDPNWTAHNGIDANTGRLNWDGTVMTEYPVYCPVDGFTVHSTDYAPQGGGNELWLLSDQKFSMFEREAYAWMPFCHAKKVLVKQGDKLKKGQLMMIADNTGFSTGLHTHMGLYRVDINPKSNGLIKLDQNNAEGSFDPSLFFTGQYAQDNATLGTLVANNLLYYRYRLGLAT